METELPVSEASAEAHAAVSSVVDAAVEQASQIAETVIEQAERRVEAAEQVAQQIGDAALMTELGKQVQALREEVGSWRMEVDRQITECRDQMTTLSSQVQELMARPSVALLPQTEQSSSIQQTLQEPTQAAVATVLPASVEVADPAPETKPKRLPRRLI